jgi:hypothetical protein
MIHLRLFMGGLAAVGFLGCARPATYDLWFYPTEKGDWRRDSRVVEYTDAAPCGYKLKGRVARIPEIPDSTFEVEQIEELDSAQRLIGKWNVPEGFWPLAVAGSEVLVNLHGTELFWIGPGGSIRPERDTTQNRSSLEADCAKPDSIAPYSLCREYPDGITGKPRRLRFEGPCT